MAIRKSGKLDILRKGILFSIPAHVNIFPFSSSCETEETIVSTAVSILREQRSRSRWNFLKSVYPNGFTPSQASKIIINLRNNAHLAFRFFQWSDRNCLCNHDLHSYSTMIHILARSRLKTPAQTLIQTALRILQNRDHDSNDAISNNPPKIFEILVKTYRSCDSSPFVFDLLVRACLQAKKIDQAAEIVRLLRSRQICPTIKTCNSLIRSICQKKGFEDGLGLYRDIFGKETRVRISPNLQTFNSLMLSLYRDQKLEQSEVILSEMSRFNCNPNVFTYNVLMAGFCDHGKIAEAVSLWNKMSMKGFEPDIVAYNTVIGGLCDNEEVDQAEAFYRQMIINEIEPTCLTFEHLIRGHCKVRNADSALLVYNDMCRRDFKPEVSTVNAVISELCRMNRISEAIEFFREVMKKGNLFPNRTSYNYLISGFCRVGKMEEALKLQAEMVGKGFEPDGNTYNYFIDGYNKHGDSEKARKVQNQMIENGLVLENSSNSIVSS